MDRIRESPLGTQTLIAENPLIGYSEGERKKSIYQQEYKMYALGNEQGSIKDLKERSRSKSRRARMEQARKDYQSEKSESMADLMRSTKLANTLPPNPLASKQRYQYSKRTIHRSDSPEFS